MLDIAGTALDEADHKRLRHPQVGGVILFSRNYQDPAQLARLCQEIHALRDPRLVVAVDHEGGRVQRFRDGFQAIPAMGHLGDLYDDEPQQAIHCAETFAWVMASELLNYGVDLSFAPVLDVANPISSVIGDRAFHRNPETVCHLANAWIRGMRAAGMEAVGKHFSGSWFCGGRFAPRDAVRPAQFRRNRGPRPDSVPASDCYPPDRGYDGARHLRAARPASGGLFTLLDRDGTA
jgi:beta-N-acetylhexosaminidase